MLLQDENLFLLLLVIQIIGVIVLLATGWRLRNLIRQYRRLLTGKGEIDLEEVLVHLGERTKRLEEGLARVEGELEKNREEARGYLQKWSLLRYKAFANTGGDQSFSLVILDRKGDGVVLSSIYGREESRIYAKAIKGGKSSYPLSEEEQQVLARALSDKTEKN
jgi:hypothetical protein